jgi:hypothetical protein
MPSIQDTGGSIQVEGLRQTIKQLEALGASKDEIVKLNVDAANTLIPAVLPEIPVYKGTHNKKTNKYYRYKGGGALKSSLRASKAKGYAQVAIGNRSVPYAGPIHWGWYYDKEYFIDKNIQPNKFLYRGLSKVYQKIIHDYDKGIQALIDKYGLGEQ